MLQRITSLIKKNWQVLTIITFSLLLFSPALNNFFSGDDWFHLKVVQISTLREFFNFFNPVLNPQSTSFYRPIPSQLFFFIFNRLFGLWALPYYVCLFCFFVASLYFFYQLLSALGFSKKTALFALFLFSVSHTHFSRLNFLSAGQEVMMGTFFLAGLLNNANKSASPTRTHFFLVLALLCKDTAIVFPLVVAVLDWVQEKKIEWKKLATLELIVCFYAFIRFVIFDTSMIDIETYKLNFSPMLLINTLYFYLLWALGGAELLQDYLSNPVTLIERYFTDFEVVGVLMIALLLLNAITLGMLGLLTLKNFSLKYVVPLVLFVVTLGPVIFLPQHKFTIQMTLPMMSFATLLAWAVENQPRVVRASLTVFFLALNLLSIYLTSQTHYSVQRSDISKKVYNYFTTTYPAHPSDAYFVFANADTPGSDISTWGSSLQISHALWGSNFAKVFFKDPSAEFYFEDVEFTAPHTKKPIIIDSGQFL